MAMILRNKDNRSEIQSKVAADLQERLNQTKPIDHQPVDPAFLDGQHNTRVAGPVIVILLLVLILTILYATTRF